MGFFDDDPFEEIVKEFFGNNSGRTRRRREEFIEGEDEDRVIDFIEDDKSVYLVFELQGYGEKDVSVSVKGRELIINAKKINSENIQNYLHQKLKQGVSIRKNLPNFILTKKFSQTMKNGILELVFDKSKK